MLVIPKGSKANFWNVVGKGAQQAGEDLGISITYRGPYKEDRHLAQTKIIEYGISQNYDAIVLAPNHVDMASHVLGKAVAGGIKVVLIDSSMSSHHHSSLVESDNYKAGQMAAAHIAALVDQEGKVVLARHLKNHASTHERENGFLDTIKSRYPRITIVAAPYIGPSLGSAYHNMSKLIDRISGIDAIFCVGEEITLGTLRAAKDRGIQKEIKFVGFDFNAMIRSAILNHEMEAAIVQDPFKIGYLGVKTAHQLVQGRTVPEKIYTDTVLVTAENYNSDRVQNILYTYDSQYD